MKKIIVSILLAVTVTMSMTGCAFTGYMEKVEDTRRELEEKRQEEEQKEKEQKEKEQKEKEQEENKQEETDKTGSDSLGEADGNGDINTEGSTEAGDNAGDEVAGWMKPNDVPFAINLDSTDAYGNSVMTEDLVAGAKVVMINFWEPWCGPCVGELGALEKLYENYKDEGLVIIGVYTTFDMPDEVISIIEGKGITYPMIYATQDCYKYMSEYVPTTCFFDSYGNPLEDAMYIGANEYGDWASIVEMRLESIDFEWGN